MISRIFRFRYIPFGYMKKILPLLVLPFLFLHLNAQNGIKWFEGSFTDALERTKTSGEFILLYGQESWCGKCRKLEQETFADSTVFQPLNESFIPVKIDLSDPEDSIPRYTYRLSVHPVCVLIRSDGQPLYKIEGFFGPETFIRKVKDGLDPGNQFWPTTELYFPPPKPPINWDTVTTVEVTSEERYYLNPAAFNDLFWHPEDEYRDPLRLSEYRKTWQKYYQEDVDRLFLRILYSRATLYAKSGDEPALNKMLASYGKYFDDLPWLTSKVRMVYHERQGNWEKWYAATVAYAESFRQSGAAELNALAFRTVSRFEDPEKLEQALKWVDQSLEKEPGYANWETKMRILFGLKREKEGLEAATTAARIAQQKGINYDALMDWLGENAPKSARKLRKALDSRKEK